MPPVVKTGTMDIFKVDELFREGKVAWIIQWIGFAESAITPATSKVADKIAFAMHPGLRDADGKLVRWANIGGQPFVMTTWNDDEMVGEMVDFVKWWLSPEIQTEFAKRGGQSGLQSVYTKPDYAELPALEPHLGAEPRLAEGRLARADLLRAAGAVAGGVRQGDHRPAVRQGDDGQHRRPSSRSI